LKILQYAYHTPITELGFYLLLEDKNKTVITRVPQNLSVNLSLISLLDLIQMILPNIGGYNIVKAYTRLHHLSATAGEDVYIWILLFFINRTWSDNHTKKKKNTFRGFSPQSKLYRPSDHRLWAKLVPTLADRVCREVSATNPHGREFSVF
jgi:hypothetical protein